MRYQIIYAKSQPLIAWADSIEEAIGKANMLEAAGYTVSVWEHSAMRAKEIQIK